MRLADLDAVIHETLRLSKTVSAVYRTALVDTTIQGVLVPKGTDVVLLLGHMGVVGSGLDGGVPSDMEDFRCVALAQTSRADSMLTPANYDLRPERWLAADGLFDAKVRAPPRPADAHPLADMPLRAPTQRFPMLPFSKGSRECIGKQLAVRAREARPSCHHSRAR